jgi:hypothetical protein
VSYRLCDGRGSLWRTAGDDAKVLFHKNFHPAMYRLCPRRVGDELVAPPAPRLGSQITTTISFSLSVDACTPTERDIIGVTTKRPELTKCAGLTHKPKNNNHNMFIDQSAITCTRIMLENGENLLNRGFS